MKKVKTGSNKVFKITPKSITKFLLYLIGTLVVLHVIAMILKVGLGHSNAWRFVPMFDVNEEKNIPALYSSLAIVLCSILLWRISLQESEQLKKHSIYWKMLSLIFLFLGFDEYFSIHEDFQVTEFLGDSATGFLHFNWFIPYLTILGIIGLFFMKFLFQLPNKTRNSFIIAGGLFLFGAVGCEMIGGEIVTERGRGGIWYAIAYTIEESLEMLGIVLFIDALMKYWLQNGSVAFYVSQDENIFDNEKEELDLKLDHKEESYKKSANCL